MARRNRRGGTVHREPDRPLAATLDRETTPLALRGVCDFLTWDERTVFAWYRLDPQRWSFLTTDDRRAILSEQATGYGDLLGRQMKLRTTFRPYPAYAWAEQMDYRTPRPIDGRAFDELLTESQRLLHSMDNSEAEHYLGVEVGARAPLDRLAARLKPESLYRRWGLHERTVRRLREDIALVDRAVMQSIGGRRVLPQELDWLLDRSRALGIPPVVPPQPDPSGLWTTSDLHAYTDGIEVEEHPFGSYVVVRDRRGTRDVERYVTVLTLGRVDAVEWPPLDLPLLAVPLACGFPVELSITGQLLTGKAVSRNLRRTITRIHTQMEDYADARMTPPPGMHNRADHAQYVGDELESPVDSTAGRWRGWVRFAVSGATPEEVADRADRLRKAFARRHVPVVREPQCRELVAEFVPHEPVSYGSYVRQWPARMFAATLPQVTSSIGDRRGFVIGHTVIGPRRPVMVDPNYGPMELSAPGLCPVIAGLGGGKSFLLGLLAEQAATAGIGTTILDPSQGAFARLTQLDHLREGARLLDLAYGKPGSMSPWAVIADPRRDHFVPGQPGEEQWNDSRAEAARERMVLAEDVCRALLPPDLANSGDVRLMLTDAVSAVGGIPGASLFDVIEELDKLGNLASRVGRHLRNLADYPRARLFFDPGHVEPIDETLVVVTFSGLVIPQLGTDRMQWTTEEQIAVPLLNLATALTFRRVARKPKDERHLAIFDELGILEQFSSFRAVFTRFSRDSRKLNTFVGKADQTPHGIARLGLLPFVGSAFVGVADSDDAAMGSLDILKVKPDPSYADVIARLPRPKPSRPLPYRDFIYRDATGVVDRIRVRADHRPGLAEVLDTTPRPAEGRGRAMSAVDGGSSSLAAVAAEGA
ncbi:MAG: Protein piccolo [Mycobacterium sp.]|nr:Protein piccolo [Mycobacterium sp.]